MLRTKHVLFDIEGTTTSISFVHETLFPYVRAHIRAHVEANWATLASSSLLRDLAAADSDCAVDSVDAVVACVARLMDADRKVTPLKSLQGDIWRDAYERGAVKGHIYEDVVPALERIKDRFKLPMSIYSSGSVAAQKLLFGFSCQGDLLPWFTAHFDTANAGSKVESASYEVIARELGLAPSELLFVTDNIAEAEAAAQVGVRCVLSVRPGTAPLPADAAARFPIVSSFDALDSHIVTLT